MIEAVTIAEAVANGRLTTYSKGSSVLELIGRRGVVDNQPLGYLVSSPPGSNVQAHFHSVDQFQVIVEGEPSLGRHPMRVGSVHYADGYTPYGPILSPATENYGYLTLRPSSITDVHWVPEEIEKAKGRSGDNFSGHAALPAERRRGLRNIFSRDDGVSASEYVAGPHEAVQPLDGRGYYIVLDGAVAFAGREYPFKSCIWTDGDENADLIAGPNGATVLLLRFRRLS